MKISMLLLAILASCLTACTSTAARPEYPITQLYKHYWLNTAIPDQPQTTASIAQSLAEYDVIFFGEFHGHPGIHLAQMQLLETIQSLRSELTLSMEQFERDTQPYIDDYMAGEIGEQYLRDKARAWDNYPTSYRPLIEYAKQHQLPVLAANAPKQAVICVGRKGLEILDEMPDTDRQHVAADIDVSDSAYRDRYMSFLSHNTSHGAGSGGDASEAMQAMANRSFAAQTVRDETMAESITQHLQRNPNRLVLHLTGHFHSDSFLGTVERLSRRMPELKIAVITPISLNRDQPSWKQTDLDTGTVLLLVGQLPDDFVQSDHAMAWSREILHQRMGNECNIQTK